MFDLTTAVPARRALLPFAGVALALALATGCGSSGGDSSSSLCSDIDSLQSSLQQLTNVDVVKNGTSTLRSAIDEVKKDAADVGTAAKDKFKPQVQALQQDLSALGDAVRNVKANGVAPVQQAVQDVKKSGSELQDAVQAKDCT